MAGDETALLMRIIGGGNNVCRKLTDDQYLQEMADHLDEMERLDTWGDGKCVLLPHDTAVLYAAALRSIAERVKGKAVGGGWNDLKLPIIR